MKVSNFDRVRRLIEEREDCLGAIDDAQCAQTDMTLIKNRDHNARIVLNDGTEQTCVDLTGCNVADELISATIQILQTRIQYLEDSLTELGVDLN